MEKISAPSVIEKESPVLREQIERAFRWYVTRFPNEWREAIRQVSLSKKNALNKHAITAGGTMLYVAEIPTRVHDLLCRLPARMGLGPQWMNNKHAMKIVLEVFNALRVNETTLPRAIGEKFEKTEDEDTLPPEEIWDRFIQSHVT